MPKQPVGTDQPVPMLAGWVAIMAVTALIFWGTLRPVRRRA